MSDETHTRIVPCPKCGKPSSLGKSYSPFCSERCKILDLGAWATEEYKIKGKNIEDQSLLDDVVTKTTLGDDQ